MKRPLRIALIAPGANVHTRRWVDALAARGHEILLISEEGSQDLPAERFDPHSGVRYFRNVRKLRALEPQYAIRKRLHAFGADVCHVHWLVSSPVVLVSLLGIRPLVISVWGSDIVWNGARREPWVRRFFQKRILGLATHITATSQFLADQTTARCRREVAVIPFGVESDRFRPAEPASARPVPVIGYLKHYAPQYGPEVLLEAASILRRRRIPFALEMYGTMDPAPYQVIADRLECQDHLTLHGAVPHAEVPATLRRFDIYVMPSIFESFGVSALEASASELPIVASRVGGTPEVVRHGETGLLVPPRDPVALADALAVLAAQPAQRHAMGKAGRAFVKRHYEWTMCVDQMEALYDRVARNLS